jgi:hypothetical protein
MGKQPLPPFVLQVLTSRYLIEGTAPGNTIVHFPDGVGIPIHLTSVQIQLTRSTEVAKHTCVDYFLTLTNAMAYIPRMDFTQDANYSSWKQYTKPITGVFHFGPYWMTGRLMTMGSNVLSGEMPIFDVCFRSQTPGTRWGDLTAPWAIVNGKWIQGWDPG